MQLASHFGFILTRRQRERNGQSVLEFWLATDSGAVRLFTPAQQPVFFIIETDLPVAESTLNQAAISFSHQSLALRTFSHKSVVGLYFANTSLAYRAKDSLKQAGVVTYEDDIRLSERYLMERFVTASCQFSGKPQGIKRYVEAKLKPADYQPSLKMLSLDIECSDSGQLYSVGLASEGYRRVLMIGQPETAPDYIRWVEDEPALLRALIEEVNHCDPDVFVGWAVVSFDFRLLIQRAQRCAIPLTLGRGGEAISWRDAANGQGFVTMPGRVIIDGIDALKTATYQFENFSLEFVSRALLGKGKHTQDVDNRLATIKHDFLHNKPKLADYNLQDCLLVLEIFAHTRLLDFLILRSKLTGLELDRSGGSVAAFINLYLPKLHRAGYISPNRPVDGGLASPGGYVMNSLPGLYQHVLVLDFKSLYPSIIRTFKIDPLGLVEGLNDPQQAIPGFRGAYFSRDKHFLPDIISELWQQRDQAKQGKDAARSQAIKILMNSFYGVLGSGGCPFYDTRLASSITLRGHEIMQTTAKWIEQAGYRVIYGDTDSTFVWLDGDYSAAQANQIGEALQLSINQQWQQKLQTEMALQCELEIEFESYFQQFLMPTIRGSEQGSKKRYAGLKVTDRGEELVFKGLETVRSDWTPMAKEFQPHLYRLIFAGKDVGDYVRQVLEQLRKGELDDKLAYRKRLRRPLSEYVKNVPPHVRAARDADEQNRLAGKALKYQGRGSISYLMTLAGPQAVEYQHSPIDYQHYIDKQIQPIADGILHFVGLSFEQLAGQQMGLF